jgi:hypothetical protein
MHAMVSYVSIMNVRESHVSVMVNPCNGKACRTMHVRVLHILVWHLRVMHVTVLYLMVCTKW